MLLFPLKEKNCALIVLLCSSALMAIWPSPNVLFFRHLFLVMGFLASLVLIYKEAVLKKLWLFGLFVSLLFWVGIHYQFFSLNPVLEWREITGLWVRVFFCFGLAIGLVVSLKKFPAFKGIFFGALFFASVIGICSYCYFSYLNKEFVDPFEFPDRQRYLFAKIETVFFGTVAVAATYANLLRFMQQDKKPILKICLCILGVTVALLAVILSNAKNGVIFISILTVTLVLIMVVPSPRVNERVLPRIILSAILLIFIMIGSLLHTKKASPGWNSLFEDVMLSTQIEKYTSWANVGGEIPINSLGDAVPLNTYLRVAWITVGLDLIKKYPLGYGSINASFGNLLSLDGVKHNIQGQVHSGWVDLGLAFGVPALIIVFVALFGIIILGILEKTEWSKLAAWIAFSILIMGFTAEITYKEEFEAYMFLIAFSAACFMPLKSEGMNLKKWAI